MGALLACGFVLLVIDLGFGFVCLIVVSRFFFFATSGCNNADGVCVCEWMERELFYEVYEDE